MDHILARLTGLIGLLLLPVGVYAQPINVALAKNGGVAEASTSYDGFAPSLANNGDRTGANGYWADNTFGVFPDWLEIRFNGFKSVSEIDVITRQDNGGTAEPTLTMTFTQQGITAFQVQYWDGVAWVNVPGGNVTENNKVWRQFTFSPIIAQRVRVLVNAALDSYSRIVELEAWGTSVASHQISGTVTVSGSPLAGVAFTATNGGSCTPSNASGQYSCAVPSSWSGTVTPALTGYVFTPASLSYSSVQTDQTGQNYTAGTIFNMARPANGGSATASSFYSGAFAPALTNNGDRTGANGYWSDNTLGVFPDWLQIDFDSLKHITEINVITRQDDAGTAEPTLEMIFTQAGITAFQVQYWDGAAWVNVPGGNVTGNDKVWRQFRFSPITTARMRVLVNSALNNYSRLVEVEAWGTQANVNLALPANGGSASASTIFSASFAAALATNGDRTGANGYWSDSTFGIFPDWLQIDFDGMKSINEINVITRQDNAGTAEPTLTMTFTQAGVTSFQVQYWDGTAWLDVPGGNVTGNNNVWRQFKFTPITTNRVRVLVNAALDSYSRLVEVEAWGIRAGINMALPVNGGTSSASSFYSDAFSAALANNGDRTGANGYWSDATFGAFPDWLQILFGGQKSISEINVITRQDNAGTAPPTLAMTFTQSGITAFQVQYAVGADWVDVPGGNVTGNNKVWRQFLFAPIVTDKIRVLVNSALDSYSRVVELEAWGTLPGTVGNLSYIHTDHLNTPRLITNQAGQTVWRWDNVEPFGGNLPNENPSGLGNFTCNLRYAGQYFDKETNLHYNYFRDYDPAIGRYIQSDPIGLAGGINTYSYVGSNPLIYEDPTGEIAWVIAGAGIGAAINVTITLAANAYSGQSTSWQQIGAAAASGAISGAFGALGGPLGGTIARTLGARATSGLAVAGSAAFSAAGGYVGQVAANCIDPANATDPLNSALWAGLGGGLATRFIATPGLTTIRQAQYFGPTTFAGVNRNAIVPSAAASAAVGGGSVLGWPIGGPPSSGCGCR
jgi:RHS repeat-associated protein